MQLDGLLVFSVRVTDNYLCLINTIGQQGLKHNVHMHAGDKLGFIFPYLWRQFYFQLWASSFVCMSLSLCLLLCQNVYTYLSCTGLW